MHRMHSQVEQRAAGEQAIGPVAWMRSFPVAARALLAGRIRCTPERVGQQLRMSDGRTYVVFRHTRATPPLPVLRGDHASHPRIAVLHPRFHLGLLPARRHRLHALFRVVCIVTTPFFAGLPGFRSKLWMVDPATGDFAGLYEWEGADEARAYAEGLAKVLRFLSVPGSVTYELRPGTAIDEYLAASGRRAA